MELEDIKYLCSTTANLAGLPIRIYKNEDCVFYYSLSNLTKDPILPFKESIFKIKNHVGYYITPRFLYYGIINYNEYKIILGPSRQKTINRNDLKELAFECDVPFDEVDDFISEIDTLVPIPFNSLLQVLCSINFVLNNEKLTLADITIYDDEQERISEQLNKNGFDENEPSNISIHNTTNPEQTILNYVRHGDTIALKEWIKKAPSVVPGTLSNDALRQVKNTFIVTATLVSRAAIQGGMDINDSLSLSDQYIQKCELLNSLESITNLQFHLVLDYTERVEKLHLGKNPSKLLVDIANYVQKNITEPIDVEALAKNMFMSRTYLATKFKKETGMTLTDFILKEKIKEAKRLLKYTDKPIASIALYLGFSSQSHFANTFKKIANTTPNEYRLKHNK